MIVLPFVTVRPRAQAASCLSNEKQIGLALALYATDFDQKLPPYDNGSRPGYVTSALGQAKKGLPLVGWSFLSDRECGSVFRYLKNSCVLICPSDPALSYHDPHRVQRLSYALNGLFLGVRQDKIAAPKDKITLADECSVRDFVFLRESAGQYVMDHFAEPANFVHFHGQNCLYLDGHAKWMSKADWPQGPGDREFWRFGVKTTGP
jgi:hypothetical protein